MAELDSENGVIHLTHYVRTGLAFQWALSRLSREVGSQHQNTCPYLFGMMFHAQTHKRELVDKLSQLDIHILYERFHQEQVV